MPLPVEAILAFLCALIVLGLWSLGANENELPMTTLIRRSLSYFAAPILIILALAHASPWAGLLLMFLAPLLEEWLKRAAALTVRPTGVFYLVSLFGIWELGLSKPLTPFLPGWVALSSPWELTVFVWLILLPIIMHCITAAIYAYYPRTNGNLRYWPCVAVHWAFNASRGLYGNVPFGTITPVPLLLDTIIWATVLICILRGKTARPGTDYQT